MRRVQEGYGQAQHAVGHFERAAGVTGERLWPQLAAALHTLAMIEMARGRVRHGLDTLARAIRLLRSAEGPVPRRWAEELRPLCQSYVRWCRRTAVAYDPALIAGVDADLSLGER